MGDTVIRRVDGSEHDDAIGLMTLAFSSDPIMRWLYPEAQRYLEHFPRFARAFGGLAFENETAWCSDDIGGASLWLAPGVHPDADAILGVVQETVPEERLQSMFGAFEQMDAFHPKEPHWYLPMIGVDPHRQGKGLGAALLRDTLAKVDEDGLPAYLESSNPANVPLYERHGFEVIGEITGSGPHIAYPMYRRARAR